MRKPALLPVCLIPLWVLKRVAQQPLFPCGCKFLCPQEFSPQDTLEPNILGWSRIQTLQPPVADLQLSMSSMCQTLALGVTFTRLSPSLYKRGMSQCYITEQPLKLTQHCRLTIFWYKIILKRMNTQLYMAYSKKTFTYFTTNGSRGKFLHPNPAEGNIFK